MFRGLTSINMDPKGRMALPTRYRDAVVDSCQGQLVVTIDTEDKCLLLFPQPDWQDIEQKIAALPSFNKMARRVQRLLIGHATELELDSAGRLMIPTPLREYAGIDKRVMLVGQGKKFEIWSEDVWTACRDQWLQEDLATDDSLPDMMQTLSL